MVDLAVTLFNQNLNNPLRGEHTGEESSWCYNDTGLQKVAAATVIKQFSGANHS